MVITGATGALGAAIATRLVCEGGLAVVTGRRRTPIDELLTQLGTEHAGMEADLSEESDVKRLFESIAKTRSKIDVLVLNAGIYERHAISEMTLGDWTRTIDSDLTSAFLCIRAGLSMFHEGTSIIMVASAAGVRAASVGHAHYGAAKSGMIGLMRALAVELGPAGIRVNAVAPTLVIGTPMGEQELDQRGAAFVSGIPLRRLALPEDVAGAVAFLASADAGYVSGSTIVISGGQMQS